MFVQGLLLKDHGDDLLLCEVKSPESLFYAYPGPSSKHGESRT